MTAHSIALGAPGLHLSPGDHVCAFYPSSAERDNILIPYLSEGLRAGDKCIAVVDSTRPDAVLETLGDRMDLDACANRYQLDIKHSEETYLRDGGFSVDAILDFWDASIGGAISDGYGFARAAGEMTWALRQLPGATELMVYEAELNKFLPRYPQVVLCMYALDSFSGEVLVDVLKTHPKVLLGGVVLDNPYYLRPDEFLAARDLMPRDGLSCPTVGFGDGDTRHREELSNLQALLMLSMLMVESGDATKILQLAASSVASFGCCRTVGVYLIESGWRTSVGALPPQQVRNEMSAQLTSIGRGGGPVSIPGEVWSWAFPLQGMTGHEGYFVVAAPRAPLDAELFVLGVLVQQTGAALANAGLHAKERSTAGELRKANVELADAVEQLEQTTEIHDRFTRVAVASEGQDGIAQAAHELTGYPVAVEDRYGNLRAWAGPGRPDPYPRDPPARREQMLRRALSEGRPMREGARLVAVASPAVDVVGVLALIDPEQRAGAKEQIALEHGATVLAMELARLRSLAETELRLRRDLVEELLAGTDEDSALARAQALGHDLEHRHRVVVFEGRGRTDDKDAFLHAVRRASTASRAGPLLVARGKAVVVLSDSEGSWETVRAGILTDLGGGRCRVGVGGWCERPSDFPRSFKEARLALKMQSIAKGPDRTTIYDDLGVYRILGENKDPAAVERFVQQWLGPLIAYDERKGSELVPTLCQYLECGGGYDRTASALSIHRSTLKYRLQRIREVSGHVLTDPDTSFNLQLCTRAWQTLQSLQD